ncbi:hypothetical protein XANCAGTX0491_008009 [Xanthoria calcicola]
MRSLTCRAVSAVPDITSRPSCPLLYGRLRPYASPRRRFCTSSKLLSADNSTPTPGIPYDHSSNSPSYPARPASNPIPEQQNTGDGDPRPAKPVDKAHYGSASRRAGRNIKKPAEVPPCHLPRRFLEKNVTVGYREAVDELRASKQSAVDKKVAWDTPRADWRFPDYSEAEQLVFEQIDLRYPHVLHEISLMVRAGLEPPAASHADAPFSAKQHLLLHCPREGSTHTLNSLVINLVLSYSADLIRIDAQDIAEIGGDYLDEPGLPPNESLSTLSYEVHTGLHEGKSTVQDLTTEEENEVGEEEEESHPRRPLPVVKAVMVNNITDLFRGKTTPFTEQQPSLQIGQPTVIADNTRKLKLETFVDTLLRACSTKRAMERVEGDSSDTNDPIHRSAEHRGIHDDSATTMKTPPIIPPPVIVLVNDYPEIYNTYNGGRVMDSLHDALYERRKEGQRYLLIGTCAARNHPLASSRPGDLDKLWEFDTGPTRTIIVPTTEEMEKFFKIDHADRTKAINIRHLQDMIRRLASDPKQVSNVVSESNLKITLEAMHGNLVDRVWSADQIHQVATLAIGCMALDKKDLSVTHIKKAMFIAWKGIAVRRDWISEEKKKREKGEKGHFQRMNKKEMSSEASQAKLRSNCNKHEARLLHGVVDPNSIRTSFADVCAPKDTIETLKTLTSLSLLRPDAFTYGVLATDKITGVLLYGPPGTGKTMLARAVAKESAATVLEVSGADLYDMWVGEAEKNVKAVFSLARKLTPCIVFIDEADAILGSRGGSSNRTSHRELINQFLREWDGMDEVSAFILVATNRPFDLDEATLRRLPRRMLVDLPTEKNRQEILKIHLKDEILDSQISLQQLATETPLYSGSDLKNLCVAAALACVREDYDADKSRAFSDSTPIAGGPRSSPSSSPLTSTTRDSPPEANALVQEPSSLSINSPYKHSSSLSEALAAASSSSNALSESLSTVSEFITSLQKSFTPLASGTTTIPTNTEQSALPVQPSDAYSTPPADSTVSSAVSSPLGYSIPESSVSAKESDPLPSEAASSEARVSAPRRILRRHHFDRALEEISASISDDMRSLAQLKKFDEKYGDRRARKGKLSGRYGFGTSNEKEREKVGQNAARVRVGQSI